MNLDETDAEVDGDKTTFGPSAANKEILELLVEQGHFKTSLGAFQAAAMLALRKGLDLSTADASAGTTWARSASSSVQILEFLRWYIPTSTPVRVLEQLGNLGATYVAERVRIGGYTLSELFELPAPQDD
jgi:hypothetical protein